MHLTIVVPVKDEPVLAAGGPLSSVTRHTWDWIIVDDGSKTPYPGATIRHEVSQGYGAAIKAGVRAATTEWVATMDGDGQHEVIDVLRLADFVDRFPAVDMVVGDRRVKETSFLRYLGRKYLNTIASFFAWRFIPDLNSGIRLFRKDIMTHYEPILCDGFSFTTTLTLCMMADGYVVDFLPIRVCPRANGSSKVRQWQDGWTTLRYIVWIGLALRTRGLRAWIRPLYRRH